MKKRILTLGLIGCLCAIGFTSCNKIKEKLFPAFEADVNDVSVTIPVTLAGVEWSSSNTVYFNLDSTIKAHTANTFGINSLSSVKVKDLTLFLTNADGLNNISNFETMRLTVFSNTNTTPATVVSTAVPDTQTDNINITATNCPELKGYLKGNQLTCTVTGKARRSTTKPLDATVSLTLSVK